MVRDYRKELHDTRNEALLSQMELNLLLMQLREEPPAMPWEYQVLEWDHSHATKKDLADFLDSYGEEDWCLVGMVPSGQKDNCYHCVFKRSKKF